MSDFMPTGPPSDEQVERALSVAREQGWLTDEGWIWDRRERYVVSYERSLWGWIPKVWDRQAHYLVLWTVWPSISRNQARRRVARAIARYERGESYMEIAS